MLEFIKVHSKDIMQTHRKKLNAEMAAVTQSSVPLLNCLSLMACFYGTSKTTPVWTDKQLRWQTLCCFYVVLSVSCQHFPASLLHINKCRNVRGKHNAPDRPAPITAMAPANFSFSKVNVIAQQMLFHLSWLRANVQHSKAIHARTKYLPTGSEKAAEIIGKLKFIFQTLIGRYLYLF